MTVNNFQKLSDQIELISALHRWARPKSGQLHGPQPISLLTFGLIAYTQCQLGVKDSDPGLLQQQQTQSGCLRKLHASTDEETFIFVVSHYLPPPNTHYQIVHFHFHFHFLRMSVG